MTAEYQTPEKALEYLARADSITERVHGERMLLELLPQQITRVIDLGTGDGRLLALVKLARPGIEAVALDFSPTMIEKAKERFDGDPLVTVSDHDFSDSISGFGQFDAVISSFAIHHVEDPRKQELYEEIFDMLTPGGVFLNLEHVSSPTEKLHDDFLSAMGITRETEDKSNRCSPVDTQLAWLRDIGFQDVDCFWKWRELALLAGTKPGA